MKFVIIVNEGPYQHQAADSAWEFARAVLDEGHTLSQVFFYHDGTYNASGLSVPPTDDRNVTRRWQELAQTRGVDLVICAAAGLRRGVVDEGEAERNRLDGHNLAHGFRVAGLAGLVEAAVQGDRLVVFGD